MTFKVGDKVRFTQDNPNGGAEYGRKGQEAVVAKTYDNRRSNEPYGVQVEVDLDGGECGFKPDAPISALELVSEAPTGPVRTVTRREVVPGVWSGVVIERPTVAVNLHVHFSLHDPSNDELRAAAAVLLELAGALDV